MFLKWRHKYVSAGWWYLGHHTWFGVRAYLQAGPDLQVGAALNRGLALTKAWWHYNTSRISGLLWGGIHRHWWIPHTKGQWCRALVMISLLVCEQIVVTLNGGHGWNETTKHPAVWCRHCNDWGSFWWLLLFVVTVVVIVVAAITHSGLVTGRSFTTRYFTLRGSYSGRT